ncbi:MAG TPA: Crp/Fnr family transcriptional regulator [Desulfobacteraceae bacterium]|nr:Crp/Fnr family transcriptional regulator [Deltaproteobacteria bacterium]HDM10873.1 Crp/Fnr family transcriptional regulator [Desulfobacteraceae bacterium]
MGIIDEIASIPLFESLSRKHLGELSMIVVDQIFKKGQEIFSEGEDGTGFYVVVSGRVKIYKVSWEGREQILHIFGPGEPFGEVPVFTGQKFPASATAIEESRIFFFPKESFVNLIRREPELALGMLAVLSMRLRRFTQLVEELSLKEVPGRLAAYLLYLSKRNNNSLELELDISKTQLASILGTIPETLSRILAKMKKGGLIDVDGSRIRILDVESLQDIADAGTGL